MEREPVFGLSDWKQSFYDFLGEEDFARATVGYKNIVDKDWSMFNK